MGPTITAENLAAKAEQAIQAYALACETHREQVDALVELQRARPTLKLEALVRLCDQPHPAKPEKKFSVTEACDVLQIDPAYGAHKVAVAKAEAAVREAEDEKMTAYLIAQLRVAQFKGEVGLT